VNETIRVKKLLEDLLSIVGIEGSVVEDPFDDSTVAYRIDCKSDDARVLIGRKGQTLETIQFLVRQICKADFDEQQHFILDVLDYRSRRKEAILSEAKEAAVQVLNGEAEEVALAPMSAFERRMAHNYLQSSFPDLSSQSYGDGPDRHIVISYTGMPEGVTEGEEDNT